MSNPEPKLNARIRFREDFEAQCQHCRDWWPLTTEFWLTRVGLRRCRACVLDMRKGRDAAYYQANAPRIRKRTAEYRAKDRRRKQLARQDPERGPIIRELQRQASQRLYYADIEASRARVRAAYERRIGRPPKPGIGRPRLDNQAA